MTNDWHLKFPCGSSVAWNAWYMIHCYCIFRLCGFLCKTGVKMIVCLVFNLLHNCRIDWYVSVKFYLEVIFAIITFWVSYSFILQGMTVAPNTSVGRTVIVLVRWLNKCKSAKSSPHYRNKFYFKKEKSNNFVISLHT